MTVLIGGVGLDLEKAIGAGARGILVSSVSTLPSEIAKARELAGTLEEAVRTALGIRAHDFSERIAK